jgi:hypothetical protein
MTICGISRNRIFQCTSAHPAARLIPYSTASEMRRPVSCANYYISCKVAICSHWQVPLMCYTWDLLKMAESEHTYMICYVRLHFCVTGLALFNYRWTGSGLAPGSPPCITGHRQSRLIVFTRRLNCAFWCVEGDTDRCEGAYTTLVDSVSVSLLFNDNITV